MNISVCMSFRNEGSEVAKTCQSIRETAGNIPIVCVNDGSDDGFDYLESLEPYGIIYYEIPQSMGSSLGRLMAIDLAPTEWFILLDAHCRFITKDWVQQLENLDLNPNGIYCLGCEPFNDAMEFTGLTKAKGLAAHFNRQTELTLFDPKWNSAKDIDETKIFDTEIILGANYICNKTWWNKIGGHNGFRRLFREETFLSIKTRMCGGVVQCIPFIITAHKFRKKAPFDVTWNALIYNELVIIYICANHLFDKYVDLLKQSRDSKIVDSVLCELNLNIYELEKERLRLALIAIIPFEQALEIIPVPKSITPIPHIIHYVWLGNNPIPGHLRLYINGWKKLLPGWEFRCWNESNFDINSSDFTRETYQRGLYGLTVDYIKPWVLYNYGGIYLDVDIELNKSLEDLSKGTEIIIGYEHTNRDMIGTAIMGGIKGDDIWKDMLDEYSQSWNEDIDCLLSNYRLNKILHQVENIIPENILYEEYAKHHSQGSWVTQLKRANLINKTKTK